jgi:hypothetical protein
MGNNYMRHQGRISSYYSAAMLLCAGAFAYAAPLSANASVTVETEVYEIAEGSFAAAPKSSVSAGRIVAARFGPFAVVGGERAELNGSIETGTPAQFREMMRRYPAIKQIDMIDCPGTGDDAANFAIARMIRKAGIATYVPDDGSVRSGGVELFLSGARRRAEPGAEFAVHSWRDEDGLEASDVAENDPLNTEYINFYREMGMEPAKAKAFYALTNSVRHDDALYLGTRDIAAYVTLD